MSNCVECNQGSTPAITLPAPPECVGTNCAEVYPSDCMVYNGPAIPCKGVTTGESLSSVLAKIGGCLQIQDTSCIDLSGDGTAASPLRATPKLKNASNNILKCGIDGLAVSVDESSVTMILNLIAGNPALKELFKTLVCDTDCVEALLCSAPTSLSGIGFCISSAYSFQATWLRNGGTTYEYRVKKSTQTTWQYGTQISYNGADGLLLFNGTVNGVALAANDTINVEVRNICASTTSAWVPVSVTIPVCASCPTPTSLYSTPGCDQVVFNWTLGTNTAVQIDYKLTSAEGFTSVNGGADITGSSITVNSLIQQSAYTWRIRGKCADGSYSAWTTLTFNTSLCGTPPPVCNAPSSVTSTII